MRPGLELFLGIQSSNFVFQRYDNIRNGVDRWIINFTSSPDMGLVEIVVQFSRNCLVVKSVAGRDISDRSYRYTNDFVVPRSLARRDA